MSVTTNIERLRRIVPEGVEIVAVSKFKSPQLIEEAYNVGQRAYGESRVQELIEKSAILPPDIRWHFIGHLQTNKVKSIIGKTFLIESVDSERLLKLIDEESRKAGIITDVLLQVHVAMEESKFGFYPEELREFISALVSDQDNSLESNSNKSLNGKTPKYGNIRILGLMGMATNTDDEDRIRQDFKTLKQLFDETRKVIIPIYPEFNKLSMGMSGDWPLAVEEGSNIVRIGSAIFGDR